MKHKQQSSLLNFFAKPDGLASSDARGNTDKGENKREGDNTTHDNDVNDAVIGPCSPHVDDESKKLFAFSTIISPPVTVKALGVPRQIGSSDRTSLLDTKSTYDFFTAGDITPATIENTPNNEKESEINEISSDIPTKSEYELLRERNIARNNARLKALGLLNEDHDKPLQRVREKKQVKRKKTAGAAEVVSYPTRRSTRRRKIVLNDGQVADVSNQDTAMVNGFAHEKSLEPVEDEPEDFAVSPLFEYNMNSEEECNYDAFTDVKNKDMASIGKTLTPFGPRLVPPSGLNAIYSLQIYPDTWNNMRNHDHETSFARRNPSWLVGAGKSGIVALWDCRRRNNMHDIEGIEPILSWKAHGGRWIADARFLPDPCSTSLNDNKTNHLPSRLLTAANDGTICHWNLSSTSVKTGAPQLLGQTSKSLHSSGIFSMDICVREANDVIIASGSKDKTIALSTIERYGDAIWRSDLHSAKVGSVSLSSYGSDPLILSASDDGLVAIHDPRINGLGDSSNAVALKIEDSHFKPHSAVWQPGSDNIFLTAGLDDVIKLWDSRKVASPLITSFHGHVLGNGKKIKRIHRPIFMTLPGSANGPFESFILSGGEGSHSLSMFQLDKIRENGSMNTVYSRGKLPLDAGDIGCLAVQKGNIAVAVEGGEVLLLSQKA